MLYHKINNIDRKKLKKITEGIKNLGSDKTLYP